MNMEKYRDMSIAIGMSEKELEEIIIDAKKAEIEHTHGVKLDTPCEEKQEEKPRVE